MNYMLSKFNMFLVILLVAGCAHQISPAKKKHEWLFAHITPFGYIGKDSTIVMPVTQEIIAFTTDPYIVHRKFNGEEFISLTDINISNNRSNEPRRAVLSWLDGNMEIEQRLLITNIAISESGDRIIYTLEKSASLEGNEEFSSPHLYIDRQNVDRWKRSKEVRNPFYMSPAVHNKPRHRLPQASEKVILPN